MQTGRQINLDMLKALATVSMIICHPVYMLGAHHPNYEQDFAYFVGDYIFGTYLAVAHAFMFAMGFAIIYSKKNTPKDLIIRGIHLYILAFILNFFRYGIYAIADGIIEGEFLPETVYSLVAQDILHFAGLALIATGIFKKLKLNAIHIFIIGIVLSIAGSFLTFTYNKTPVLNYIVGHFIVTTKDDSCFAFFNWYFFVSTGILFGEIIRKTEDLDKFYKKVFAISFSVMALYITLTVVYGVMFLTKEKWYYGTSLLESIGLLSIDLTLLSVFHFTENKLKINTIKSITTMSKNVNKIYCVHWCIIGFVDSIFCYLMEIVFPYTFIYFFAILLIFVSYKIANIWSKMEFQRQSCKKIKNATT